MPPCRKRLEDDNLPFLPQSPDEDINTENEDPEEEEDRARQQQQLRHQWIENRIRVRVLNEIQEYERNDNDADLLLLSALNAMSIADLQWRAALKRPWWLWIVGILDMILPISMTMWLIHFEMVENDRVDAEALDRDELTFTFIMIVLLQIIKVVTGLMVFVALCVSNDATYMFFLLGHLYGSYLIVGIMTVMVASMMITSRMDRYGYDRWQRIMAQMLSLLVRLPEIMMVHDLIVKYKRPVEALRVEMEQQRQLVDAWRRNIRMRLEMQRRARARWANRTEGYVV